MTVIEQEFYIILKDTDGDLNFLSEVEDKLKDFKNNNIVIDLSENEDLAQKELLLFLSLSNEHRERQKSFVLVNNHVGIDDIPGELIVVPTLLEAEDLIKMEEIERDLGF